MSPQDFDKVYCPKCEAVNPGAAPLCTGCGHPLQALTEAPALEPLPSEQRTPDPVTQDQIAEAVKRGILLAKTRSDGAEAVNMISRIIAGFVCFFCAGTALEDGNFVVAIFAAMFFWFTFRRL